MKQKIFFWNSLALSIIQWMLEIWSLVSLPLQNPACTSGISWFTYCWSLAWRILCTTLLACELSTIVWEFEHSLALPIWEIKFVQFSYTWIYYTYDQKSIIYRIDSPVNQNASFGLFFLLGAFQNKGDSNSFIHKYGAKHYSIPMYEWPKFV